MLRMLTQYFGFIKEEEILVTYPETFTSTDSIDLKLEYLKSLEGQESSRQTTIETKTSQLIGQTGIIFSLLSLFIGNYISKFSSWPGTLQTFLIVFFLAALFFYLSAIFQATKYLNIHKYVYGQRSVSTVKTRFVNDEAFKVEEIKDLIYSIERNTQVNNQKSNNLIYAYRSFRIGTLIVGMLTILLIASGYFTPSSPINKLEIQQPIIIQGLDSSLEGLKNEIGKRSATPIIMRDTIIIKR